MRKLVIIAAMVASALGGAAACANKPATPTPSTSTTGTAADETKSVCTDAKSASTTAIATLKVKLAEGTSAMLAGDQAKALAAQTAAKTTATEWTTKLTTLSAKPIKPEVKVVLTNGVVTINTLLAGLATNTTTVADAETKLNDFTAKLATACA